MNTSTRLTGYATLSLLIIGIAALVVMTMNVQADETTNTAATTFQHGPNFVDANGDGYNDNAPDDDGDGIPNGQDSDYKRPQNGNGKHLGNGRHHGAAIGKALGGRGRRGQCNGQCTYTSENTTDTTEESAK